MSNATFFDIIQKAEIHIFRTQDINTVAWGVLCDKAICPDDKIYTEYSVNAETVEFEFDYNLTFDDLERLKPLTGLRYDDDENTEASKDLKEFFLNYTNYKPKDFISILEIEIAIESNYTKRKSICNEYGRKLTIHNLEDLCFLYKIIDKHKMHIPMVTIKPMNYNYHHVPDFIENFKSYIKSRHTLTNARFNYIYALNSYKCYEQAFESIVSCLPFELSEDDYKGLKYHYLNNQLSQYYYSQPIMTKLFLATSLLSFRLGLKVFIGPISLIKTIKQTLVKSYNARVNLDYEKQNADWKADRYINWYHRDNFDHIIESDVIIHNKIYQNCEIPFEKIEKKVPESPGSPSNTQVIYEEDKFVVNDKIVDKIPLGVLPIDAMINITSFLSNQSSKVKEMHDQKQDRKTIVETLREERKRTVSDVILQ